MKIFMMLIGLFVLTMVCLALNAAVVSLLMRYGPIVVRFGRIVLKRYSRVQLRALSPSRIWTTVALQVIGAVVFFMLIHEPMSLLTLASTLFGYIFFVSALTLSLLAQLPILKTLWHDVVSKLSLVAFPVFFGFIAKGYASQWVGDVLGTSAANGSSAWFAATVFLLCLIAAAVLFFVAFIFELALAFSPMVAITKNGELKRGLFLLALCSFLGTLAAGNAALQLSSSRLGNLLLAAVVFEFDASPPTYCDLSANEKDLTQGPEPFLKVVYLSTSQERAMLLRRGPTLFRPVVLKYLKTDDIASYLQKLRVVACFKVPEPISNVRLR